ncbi:MAG: protein-ADP-ribose hydrolase [Oscillospiraceae bacterium]|nr:protein-ADP-ribose hydrolase [Oscillospiraceae bacterium]
MNQQERCLWLIKALLKDMPQYMDTPIPTLPDHRWRLLRSLMNVRPPMPVSEEFLQIQDAFLKQMTTEKVIVVANDLPASQRDERLVLWQGDITTLKCDAIVNAANSQMLGCFSPCHGCIDNIIHTMAGVQLRLACYELMQKQGHEEPTGQAKITPGFNLPAKFVLHTVGPIVAGPLTREHEQLLASCYRSCLKLAVENGCESIAFCCISTGVFCFPADRAAEIAIQTVRDYLREQGSIRRVIFNVFKDSDLNIYRQLLS